MRVSKIRPNSYKHSFPAANLKIIKLEVLFLNYNIFSKFWNLKYTKKCLLQLWNTLVLNRTSVTRPWSITSTVRNPGTSTGLAIRTCPWPDHKCLRVVITEFGTDTFWTFGYSENWFSNNFKISTANIVKNTYLKFKPWWTNKNVSIMIKNGKQGRFYELLYVITRT